LLPLRHGAAGIARDDAMPAGACAAAASFVRAEVHGKVPVVRHPLACSVLALAALVAGPALAGGFAEPIAVPVVAPAVVPVIAPASDWTGGYAGVQVSAGTLSFNAGGTTFDDTDFDGTLLGVHAGYQRGFGRFVLGGEVQFDTSDIGQDGAVEAVFDFEFDSVLRAGVRAGYDAGRLLPYVTGGYVGAQLDVFDAEGDLSGGYFGVGVDYRLRDNVTLGAQVLRSTFSEGDGLDLSGSEEVDLDTFSLRATYNF
jgi:hypothetical protein